MKKKDTQNLKIKQFFAKNNIKYIIFDMDRTLVDTGPYFNKRMYKAMLKVIKNIYPNKSISKQMEITSQIRSISNDIFLKNPIPTPVDQLSYQAFEIYFSDNKKDYDKEEILKSLKLSFKNFYNISPSLFPYTVKTLNQIKNAGIKMGVYSHAQQQWTEKKIEKIKNAYKRKYDKDLDLPFYTTDIKDSKDCDGWKKAGKYLKFDIDRTLVVGDSLTSDIYPAIDAGYRCLVYLVYDKGIPKIEKEARVYITQNIGTMFDNL